MPPPPPPPLPPLLRPTNSPGSISLPPPPPPPPPPSSTLKTTALLISSSSSLATPLPAQLSADHHSTAADLEQQVISEEVYANLEEIKPNAISVDHDLSTLTRESAKGSVTKFGKDMETSTITSATESNDNHDNLRDDLKTTTMLTTRSAPAENGTSLSGTSSITASPRRPRRTGTGMPVVRNFSTMEFESTEGLKERAARDEFDEELLHHLSDDKEAQMINDALRSVTFHQVSDDEELSDEDTASAQKDDNGYTGPDESFDRSDNWDTIQLQRYRQSTVRSNWRRIPSEVGLEGCEGCERLCVENRKLRRQLDELEFELASGVLHNPADGFDPPTLMGHFPAAPQLPIPGKKQGGWTSRFRHATSAQLTGTRSGRSGNRSERERLKDEVQALNVTTEYLWRKLNKAEMELSSYRRKELHERMRVNSQYRGKTSNSHR